MQEAKDGRGVVVLASRDEPTGRFRKEVDDADEEDGDDHLVADREPPGQLNVGHERETVLRRKRNDHQGQYKDMRMRLVLTEIQ